MIYTQVRACQLDDFIEADIAVVGTDMHFIDHKLKLFTVSDYYYCSLKLALGHIWTRASLKYVLRLGAELLVYLFMYNLHHWIAHCS